MELFQGLIQPPKVQSADEAIPTLCDRVESATLISDRRSAVLGLKAFSRDYRETVIASGLKPLLNTLKRDYEDESSVKAVLETLLILFIRGDGSDDLTRNWISQHSRLQNGKYPSPLVMKQEREQVDQFSLWIADAITQTDEIVHLVIELLNTGNFHIRLYTTQLLEAIVATRPVRSRNAITSLPTGISSLVSLLKDAHEPVRDEAVLLLMAVVNDSPHVQKLVAFENIFDQLFSIIDEEGGLRGSLVVNDCLSLVNNILKYNASNQTLFIETGNLPKLAQILDEPLSDAEFFWNDQRVININTALDIVSLTVEPGKSTTEKHQNTLMDSSVLMVVLRLAFYDKIPKTVRPTALNTAADLIRGNENCQHEFDKIDVPFFDPSSPLASNAENTPLVPVVTLLLHWVSFANSIQSFPTRMASLELIKAYLAESEDIQLKFLSQQIENYNEKNFSREDKPFTACNIFRILLDYDPDLKLNPYKLFFTADIFMFLFGTDNEANHKVRNLVRSVKSGVNLDEGDVLSPVQMVSELLITSLSAEDVRIPISYVTLLIFWLFGDTSAVDDFLSEKNVIQSLLSFSYQLQDDDVTTKCLVTMLLGVSYEFSSADSPFPRKDYFEYITKTLGKDNYFTRINQFKADSLFTKVQGSGSTPTLQFDETGLPQVYFSPIFVRFFTENIYRIKTALLHDPDEEPCARISFEAFEKMQNECATLRSKINSLEETSEKQISKLKDELEVLSQEHEKYSEDNKSLGAKYSILLGNHEKLQKEISEASDTIEELNRERQKLSSLRDESARDLEFKGSELRKSSERIALLEKELQDVKAGKQKAEDGINKMSRELFSLTKENQKLQESLKKIEKDRRKELDELDDKRKKLEASNKQVEALQAEKLVSLKELNEWKSRFQSHDTLLPRLTDKLRSLAENFKETQNERDTLAKTLETIKIQSEKDNAGLVEKVNTLMTEKAAVMSENKNKESRIEELQQKIEEIQRKVEADESATSQNKNEMESTLCKLRAEVEAIEAQKLELTVNNNKLQEEINRYQAAGDESTLELGKIEDALRESKSELANVAENKKSLQASFEKQKSQLDQSLTKLTNLEKARNMDVKRISSLEAEIRRGEEAHELEISRLNNDIQKLQSEKKDNSSSVVSLKEAVEQGRQKIVTLTSELAEMRNAHQKSQTQLDESATQHDEMVEKLKTEKRDVETKLNDVASEKASLEHDLEGSKGIEKMLASELEAMKLTLQEKEDTYKKVQESEQSISSKFEVIKADLQEKVKRLEAQSDDLQTKLKKKTLEFEKERQFLTNGSDLVTQEYSKKINTLEEQIDSTEKQVEEMKTDLRESEKTAKKLKSESLSLQKSSESKIESLTSALNSSKTQAEENIKRYDELKKLNEKKILGLEAEIDGLTKAAETSTEANESYTINLKELEGKIESQNDTIEKLKDVERAKNELQQKVENLNDAQNNIIEEYETKVKSLTKDRESAEAKLRGQSESLEKSEHILEENEKLKKKVESLEALKVTFDKSLDESKSVMMQHEDKIKALDFTNSSLTSQVNAGESEVARLEKLIREKELHLTNGKEELSQTAELNERILALERQNEELRSKAETSSEVDDLMLLVTDLDEKNARYRSLLKKNAIQFSSDDEGDDEESDEDENSDHDEND